MINTFSHKIKISQYSIITCYDIIFDVTFVIYSYFVWNFLKCFKTLGIFLRLKLDLNILFP